MAVLVPTDFDNRRHRPFALASSTQATKAISSSNENEAGDQVIRIYPGERVCRCV